MAYITLFCAILGIGGSYATLYVVIAESVPTAQLGGVMVVSCAAAVLSTTGAPLVVLLSEPFPYIFLASMLALSIILSFCLKKVSAGPKLEGNESLVQNLYLDTHGDSI